jgi:hypothetical protein
MTTPRQIKAVDLDEILQKAAEEIGENIRKNHFRRLRGRRAEIVEKQDVDLARLLAELDQEEEEGGEED